jgi:hypothetical protein
MRPAGRIGFALYFRILLEVHRGGQTTPQIAQRARACSVEQCLSILNSLRTLRLVRREQQRVWQRGTTYCWWFGADADIRVQTGRPAKLRADIITLASIIRAAQRNMTATAMAAEVGLTKPALGRHLAQGRAIGQVFPVVDWTVQPGCAPVAVYGFHIGRQDMPPPPPKPRQRINAEFRSRQQERALFSQAVRELSRNASIFNLAAGSAASTSAKDYL